MADQLKDKVKYAEDYYKQNIGRVIELGDVCACFDEIKKEIEERTKSAVENWDLMKSNGYSDIINIIDKHSGFGGDKK